MVVIKGKNRIISDILNIKKLAEQVLDEIKKDKLDSAREDLQRIAQWDIDEFREVQQKYGDEQLALHCRTILHATQQGIKALEGRESQAAQKLLNSILLLVNYDLRKTQDFEKLETEVKNRLLALLSKDRLDKEQISTFLKQIKKVVSPVFYKKVELRLQEKMLKKPMSSDEEIVKQNLQIMFSTADGGMHSPQHNESIGGNAGQFEDYGCYGLNFFYNKDSGRIMYFGNSQYVPKNIRENYSEGSFIIALMEKEVPIVTISIRDKQILPRVRAIITQSAEEYNRINNYRQIRF